MLSTGICLRQSARLHLCLMLKLQLSYSFFLQPLESLYVRRAQNSFLIIISSEASNRYFSSLVEIKLITARLPLALVLKLEVYLHVDNERKLQLSQLSNFSF